MKSSDGDFSFDYLFKIVLIGDPGVGKTCIVQRFKKGTFVEKHGSTIGVDFTMKTLEVDSKKIKVSYTKCNLHLSPFKKVLYLTWRNFKKGKSKRLASFSP